MNIQASPNYQIHSYTYGWEIHKRRIRQRDSEHGKAGEEYYSLASAPYPATLALALESVMERELKASPDCDLSGLESALKHAVGLVHKYCAMARAAA